MTETDQHEHGVHGQIARLARRLHGTTRSIRFSEPQNVLLEVTQGAVDVLPGVDHAGVTLVRKKARGSRPAELESTAATGDIPRLVDRLQHQTGQGPCFDAVWQQQTMYLADFASETRWPDFIRAVEEQTPVRSVLSIQLFVTDDELGALNLYSEHPDAFDDAAEDLATNLATHAAIALSGARRGEQFRSALASRDIIGQAKGIIMERFDTDALAAFELLRQLSQETNTPLSELAEKLVMKDHPPPDEAP
ncbi:GAF and ANTAR domain-containing protein [Gordonia sp. PKS22-38]|uniref:GAF and ANTAR domain-containing protein n=1 Tax=Gordonia prachuapensis TaxID=3115651 RepID=A0ABU7MU68_9ACTN|nr:GAF and ANTAR domain-containing protein [Gordonia sp. PKS22-38]